MGTGIAQLLLNSNYTVSVYEPVEAARSKVAPAVERISAAIGDSAGRLGALAVTDNLEAAVASCEFIIEAIPEKLELKQKIYAQLAELADPHAILATNSSVIPVTSIAEHLADEVAARVVGMHFWNPPYLLPLVEVIQGERTTPETILRSLEFLEDAGKAPVHVKKDMVIGNRVHHALWREAIALVASGAIDAAGIDNVIKNSFGIRLAVLGPLENADLVGIELTQDVHRVVFPELSNETEPNPVLQAMLDAGDTGMASGRGFYEWTPETADAKRAALTEHLLGARSLRNSASTGKSRRQD